MRTRSPFPSLLGALAISLLLPPIPTLNAKENSGPTWAIAIHGGAGSNPANWKPKNRTARKAGLNKALEAGKNILKNGGSALDAVETVIRTLEDDASFNAGRGAVVTSEGKAELDASIMDGQTRQCGAVAGVTIAKNPINLARKVMTNTKHVLLVAKGADEFAAQQQVPLVKPDYFLSFKKATSSTPDPNGKMSLSTDQDTDAHYGTVGCVALDAAGHLAAGTSTGGTSKKLPGRVGDSPIIGAGTFADDETCAVSGTGIGEQYIRHAIAYDVVAQMQYSGASLSSAITSVMQDRLNKGDGGIISLSKDGEISMQHTTPGMSCGLADSTGKFETHLVLENGQLNAPAISSSAANAPDADALAQDNDIEAIRKSIVQQSADWNAGDLDAFMSVYWKSENLTFSSAGQTTRGWDATIARYRTRYPDKAAMGETEFSDLEFVRLDRNAFQVLGRWELKRESNPIGGRFTLIFKKIRGDWKIVHDHTSARKE